MNRFINVRFFRHLTGNPVLNRQFSCVTKYNKKCNLPTKDNLFISWKNYCSTTNYDLEDTGLMNKELFDKFTEKDPELGKRIKLSLMEIENFKAEGQLVPVKMKERHWNEYLWLQSTASKLKFLTFLAKNEFSSANLAARKARKAEKYQARLKEINLPNHIEYGLGKNSYFMSINQSSVMHMLNTKLLAAELFENQVIFDMGFEKYMTRRQVKECAKQLLYTFATNRSHHNPYHIHLCNFPTDTFLSETITRFFNNNINEFPLGIHTESYTEVFDKDRLVYLTPDSPNRLLYHPDDIYIIGAFIDTGPSLPISFAKAKADKIRTAKFPLDKYLKWKQGKKALPLDIVLKILLDLQFYRDWNKAFKHIPRRMIDSFDNLDDESNELNEYNFPKVVKESDKVKPKKRQWRNEPYVLNLKDAQVQKS